MVSVPRPESFVCSSSWWWVLPIPVLSLSKLQLPLKHPSLCAGVINDTVWQNTKLESQQQFVLIPENTSHTLSFLEEKPPKSFQAFPNSGGTPSRSEITLSYSVCLHQSSICLSAACWTLQNQFLGTGFPLSVGSSPSYRLSALHSPITY